MKKRFPFALLSLILASDVVTSDAVDVGLFTTDRSARALSHVQAGLDDDSLDQSALGRSFFTIPWVEAPSATTARDGLGPLFNANSCASCHKNNGGGAASTLGGKSLSRSIVIKLAQRVDALSNQTNLNAGFKPDPVYGGQLAINGTSDVPFEGQVAVTIDSRIFTYPDGRQVTLTKPLFRISQLNYGPLSETTTLQPRRSPALIGMGLVDAIPDTQLIQRQDEHDQNNDGISGRASWVFSVEEKKLKLGRFGWKASTTSVNEQVANAAHNDMGLTNPLFPDENCTAAQTACNRAYKSGGFDIPEQRLKAVSFYLRHLRVPVSQSVAQEEGGQLFLSTGCQACHQTAYTTDKGVEVNPYSDFLLHDMGDDLADDSGFTGSSLTGTDRQVQGAEWRTAPLWGLGLAKTLNPQAGYLHDGRATTIEQAILWHDGEALKAKNRFTQLNKKERDLLLSFLDVL
ncbi:MAG: thiol oxidoreductase [Cellvibrionales bacterium]|nr:MAG: thiol oxidoreductase [Cellvibrionales bacterium]